MKTHRITSRQRGFTLLELLVAMVITTLIVTVLVSITSYSLETFNRSRSELRASRQAKAMLDTMGRDFESLIVRSGGKSEWLSATATTALPGTNIKSTNAANLAFFIAGTDRYDGQIGITGKDLGGDISCVGYSLAYRDPIVTGGTATTFVLNRLLVSPDLVFNELLGKTDITVSAQSLEKVFSGSTTGGTLNNPENFLCENIYQFSLTFQLQGTLPPVPPSTVGESFTVPVTLSPTAAESLIISGAGTAIKGGTITPAQLAAGKVTAVEISVTILSDFAIEQLRNRNFTETTEADFIAKYSYQYSKLVQLPTF